MKKIIALILAALMSIALFACGNDGDGKDNKDKNEDKTEVAYYDECAELPTLNSVTAATPSTHKTSSTNGEVTSIVYTYTGVSEEIVKAYIDSITQMGFEVEQGDDGEYTICKDGYILANFSTEGQTLTMSILPVKQEKNAPVWQCSAYVDEFEQPTDEKFITNIDTIYGKFSNSATTDSSLAVQILADKTSGIGIVLWEYGRNQVKNAFTYDDEYNITIRYADGSKESLTGAVYGGGGDRIMVTGDNAEILLNALRGDSDFSIYIADSNNAATNYLFTLSPSNFAELYDQI